MNEPTPKRTAELLRVIFQVLWSKPDGLPARDVLEAVFRKIKIADEDHPLASGSFAPQYERNIRTTSNLLAEVGWLVKNKERWCLTDEGRAACRSIKNSDEIYNNALFLCEEKKNLREDLLLTIESAEEKAWQQIWQYLNEMNPTEFKLLVGDLLTAFDFHLEWVSPPGKDHGYIDIIAYPNPPGSSGTRIKVHVKHTGQAATLEGLRAFFGVLTPHDLGIFVSSGGFTDTFMEEVSGQDLRRIQLVSLKNFIHLWIQNYEKLSPEARYRFPLKAIYFLSPQK